MSDVLIPEGFDPIAKSELMHNTAEAYFNRDRVQVFAVVDNKPVGPFNRGELEALMHVLTDVTFLKKGKW